MTHSHTHNANVSDEFKTIYNEIKNHISGTFLNKVKDEEIALFIVRDKEVSYSKALNEALKDGSFSEDEVQYLRCNTCGYFYHKYGTLVSINVEGEVKSMVWDIETYLSDFPKFKTFFKSLKEQVEEATIKHPAYDIRELISVGETPYKEKGGFNHFVLFWDFEDSSAIEKIKTAFEYNENLFHLETNLKNCYRDDTLEKALFSLQGNNSVHSERVKKIIKGHIEIRDTLKKCGKEKYKIVKMYLASNYSSSFLQINNTSLGILIDGIMKGEVEKSMNLFIKATDPAFYQRTLREAKLKEIEDTEKFIIDNNITLGRRYVDMSEITDHVIWSCKTEEEKKDSIFSKLKNSEKEESDKVKDKLENVGYPIQVFSIETFLEYIKNTEIKNLYHYFNNEGGDIVTGSVSENPVRMWKWEDDENIQPYSWICTNLRGRYNYTQFSFRKVENIITHPGEWGVNDCNYKGIMFINTKENSVSLMSKLKNNPGIGLFSEILDSRFHQHRRVIEEYSNKENLQIPSNIVYPAVGVIMTKGECQNIIIIEFEKTALIAFITYSPFNIDKDKIIKITKKMIS